MTGAAATAAASAATASGTPTKNASKGRELFCLQLLVLLVQLGIPIYYYHTTITAGTWLTTCAQAASMVALYLRGPTDDCQNEFSDGDS